eukprot:TRINITY_DN7883_c0_g1_i12.p1 TRINITY_DN7883_c0_g1~~TRINITY_DN7883_c0_g1_i12.p1  ORF type:complete len:172 (-),score=59.24 TRINITY_DN7883_c0_g1_i12:166-681(-)
MLRKALARTFTLASFTLRPYSSFILPRTSMITRPVFRPAMCGLIPMQTRGFAEGESDCIKELKKYEEWDNYANKVSNEKPVIVEFFAKWCGSCKLLTPMMERKVKEQKGKVLLLKVNIDKCPELAGELGINLIPRVFLRHKGKVVSDFTGKQKEEELDKFITKAANLAEDK